MDARHAEQPDRDLEAVDAEIEQLRIENESWQINIGRFRVQSRMNSIALARVFLLFHVLAGVIGAAMILAEGPLRELGIAIVVGALFGFGSFLTEVWAQGMENERSFYESSAGEARKARLQQLLARRDEIVRQAGPDGSRPNTRTGDSGNTLRNALRKHWPWGILASVVVVRSLARRRRPDRSA